MNLDDDTVIELGLYCEDLLKQDYFNALARHFEASASQEILSTAPNQTELREATYYQFQGFQQFLGLMATFVQSKNRLTDPAPSPEEGDAHDQRIDT